MTDHIHPRLLSRVERSLSKRVSGDLGPVLQRFAAQASDEDEFMAAAARLIINSRERDEWLASWATRRLDLDTPTGAMPLDSMPANLESLSQPMALQRSFRISPAQLERLREALAFEMGPIARTLIEREAERSESASELVSRLQVHLNHEVQRSRFVQAVLSKSLHEDA